MTSAETNRQVVGAYFDALADGNAEALFVLYDPAVIQTEWPNALKPQGDQRDLTQMRADFERGKGVMRSQAYDIKAIVCDGDTVAVEATWRGVLNVTLGRLEPGEAMTAHIATLFTLKDGLIVSQRNYDCFEAFQ